MNRYRWLFGCLSVLLLVLSACGSAPNAPAVAPAAPAAGAAPTTVAGSATKTEIVMAITPDNEPDEGFDPTFGWGSYGTPLFQSTLLRRDVDLNLVNDLAESYSLSEDRLTWTVTIRKDAMFSDGTPLTARDVAFTFKKAAENAGLTDVTVLKEAVATNDHEVVFQLKQPQSTFVNRLASIGIVPQHAYDENYGSNPIGSGPYKLVQWERGQQVIVEANPLYYGTKPQIERMIFLFTEEDTAFAAAKAGEVDLLLVPQALAVQQIDGMRMYAIKSVDNRGLSFPFVPDTGAKSPQGNPIGNNVTADLAIRQAVNYALDRQALVDAVLEGFGSPAYGSVSGLPWEQTEAALASTGTDLAKATLAKAGWQDSDGDGIVEKNGLKAEFTLIYPASDSTRQGLALAAAPMIEKAGINVNVEGKSWDEIEKLMHSNVILFGWGSHDPGELYNLYHSSSALGSYANASYYNNPAIDSYLDMAMGAPSPAEANAYWKNAQWDGTIGVAAKGDAAWAWLVNLDHTYFINNCLDIGKPQLEPHSHGWMITATITSWKWNC